MATSSKIRDARRLLRSAGRVYVSVSFGGNSAIGELYLTKSQGLGILKDIEDNLTGDDEERREAAMEQYIDVDTGTYRSVSFGHRNDY